MTLDLWHHRKQKNSLCKVTYLLQRQVSLPRSSHRFSSPEVPALALETKWSLNKYGLASSYQFTTIMSHTQLSFLSPQTSHKVTFPQAYGSSILKPACSQGAFVEWVYSEFLLLPHPLLQERQLWTLGWVRGRCYLFSSVPDRDTTDL